MLFYNIEFRHIACQINSDVSRVGPEILLLSSCTKNGGRQVVYTDASSATTALGFTIMQASDVNYMGQLVSNKWQVWSFQMVKRAWQLTKTLYQNNWRLQLI